MTSTFPNALAKHPRAILVIGCVAQGMVVLDVTIVNVALPSMRRALHLSPAGQQWIVTAYVLVFGGFLLLGGRLGDLYGRRRMFLAGLTVFSVASLAGGLASDGGLLIGARAVQGLGAAVLAPSTLSLLTTTFPDPGERARALTAWSNTAAVGGTLGLVIGGVLTAALSWRWVLFVNAPIGAGLLLASFMYLHVPESRTEHRTLDVPGAVTVTGGVSLLIYAIVTTDHHAWASVHTLGLLGLALSVLALFAVIERRSPEPLVVARVLTRRASVGANTISLLLGGMIQTQLFLETLYLQQVNGYSALHAGLVLLPTGVAALTASQLSGRLAPKVGVRAVLIVGPIIGVAGSLWLAQIKAGDPFWPAVGIPAVLAVLGSACCFVPMTLAATQGIAPADAGLASGLLQSARQVGGALFLATLITVATSDTSSILRRTPGRPSPDATARALTSGYDRAFLLSAALPLAIAFVAALVLPRLRPPGTAEVRDDAALAIEAP